MGALLGTCLVSQSALEKLDFGECAIGTGAATLLVQGCGTKLKHLDLSGCMLMRDSVLGVRDDIKSVCQALGDGMYKQLTHLNLATNSVGQREGGSMLCKHLCSYALPNLPCLALLNLTDCDLYQDEMAKLSETLPQNTCLAHLFLGLNACGSQGACAIAEIMTTCVGLNSLSIEGCCLGFAGAEILADGMRIGCTRGLSRLDISDNFFTEDGCDLLAEQLRKFKFLRDLYIGGNEIEFGSCAVQLLIEELDLCSVVL